jgi:hypothetical protein
MKKNLNLIGTLLILGGIGSPGCGGPDGPDALGAPELEALEAQAASPLEGDAAEPGISSVAWRGDFETGNISQWTRAQMVSADRLQVVSSPVRQGRYALKVTVRQGDNPISSSGNRNELVRMTLEPTGSEYYYRWSTMFAADYPIANTWQLFAQWHHQGSSGSPPVEFIVVGQEMRLRVGGSGGAIVWTAPLVRGAWQDFIFHVKWSPDPRVGFVELYHNGRLVVPRRNIATQFSGQLNYLKVGLYRNSTIAPTGVLYHDGWVQGQTLADVQGAGISLFDEAMAQEPVEAPAEQ